MNGFEQTGETFLGDGIYASYGMGAIKLRVERLGPDVNIWLSPETIDALSGFAVARPDATRSGCWEA